MSYKILKCDLSSWMRHHASYSEQKSNIFIIRKQVGGAADACGPTCETDSSVRFNLQNCNIILSKNFITEQTRFKMIEN